MPMHNEKEILIQITGGNQQAFKKLFDHYSPNLYTTAIRITGDPLIAQEILQDAFLKVWINRAKLDTIDNFAGWLYVIAENITFNCLKILQREKKINQPLLEKVYLQIASTNQDQLQNKEYEAILNQAIKRLPDKQQKTYVLIKQQGIKRNEAALILKVSPETVKWNLEQAMRSVRAFCIANLDLLTIISLMMILF